jgi:diaminopropionate ammonia-lyase
VRMRALVNPALRTSAVPAPSTDALGFHAELEGYRPTPLRDLPAIAAELGLGVVLLKDESDRMGLPAFKVLGAWWAVERALREQPGVRTLVAASAGNHGRAVARVAALRGLGCRIYLPAGSAPARAEAIAAEGADVVVTGGSYERAVEQATRAGGEPGAIEIADVGESGPARWVIDGYQTLYAEIEAGGGCDVVLVPA